MASAAAIIETLDTSAGKLAKSIQVTYDQIDYVGCERKEVKECLRRRDCTRADAKRMKKALKERRKTLEETLGVLLAEWTETRDGIDAVAENVRTYADR